MKIFRHQRIACCTTLSHSQPLQDVPCWLSSLLSCSVHLPAVLWCTGTFTAPGQIVGCACRMCSQAMALPAIWHAKTPALRLRVPRVCCSVHLAAAAVPQPPLVRPIDCDSRECVCSCRARVQSACQMMLHQLGSSGTALQTCQSQAGDSGHCT